LGLLLAVGAGGALGASARTLAEVVSIHGGLPLAMAAVNLSGSLLIGLFARLTEPEGRWFVGSRGRHFVMTGLLGGFTTFSVFSLEAVRLAIAGQAVLASTYFAGTAIICLVGVWLGDVLGRRINALA
jgi:CrcB protein